MEELLLGEVEVNLFLLAMLEGWEVDRLPWVGVLDGDALRAVALVLPGQVAVAYAPEAAHGALMGSAAPPFQPDTLVIGPRDASDQLWSTWASGQRWGRRYNQRLYVAREPSARSTLPGLRLARAADEEELLARSIQMEIDDLGFDPSTRNPESFRYSVQRRIQEGRTWVLEEGGRLLYHINVGVQVSWGCQIGGTYVPPALRGQGIATEATRQIVSRLLERNPIVTLHVNEANTPAVRVYERAGFQRAAPFRLITTPARPETQR
ncbi:MAG: GNAT family N-acetyltransferase [Deltaproteobacteria bacterium]|nr:GNAT family N-acetyltransferase [Deltaproteobacteria bacterium]